MTTALALSVRACARSISGRVPTFTKPSICCRCRSWLSSVSLATTISAFCARAPKYATRTDAPTCSVVAFSVAAVASVVAWPDFQR